MAEETKACPEQETEVNTGPAAEETEKADEKQEKKKKKDYDLEDEYYDLEGF